ncbi:MAG: PDZ domain-containing protein [Nitrospirae bacterium]|nr:MAG: PDZ domain-containing protein [Nitrospirota bacterium]
MFIRLAVLIIFGLGFLSGCITISKQEYQSGMIWNTVTARDYIDAGVRIEAECNFTPEYKQLWFEWMNTEESIMNYNLALCERIVEDMTKSRLFSRVNVGSYDMLMRIEHSESKTEHKTVVSVKDKNNRDIGVNYTGSAMRRGYGGESFHASLSQLLSDIRDQMMADYKAGKGIAVALGGGVQTAGYDYDAQSGGGGLGVQIQPVTAELARQFGLSEAKGALVTDVLKGSSADKAGIRRGDIILEFNRTKISMPKDLQNAVASSRAEENALLLISRDRASIFLTAKLGAVQSGVARPLKKEEPLFVPAPPDIKLPPLRSDTYAVVVGIDYKGREEIPNLNYASADAAKVYDILTDPRYGGVPKENTVLLLNEKATRNEMVTALRKIKSWDGFVYVYYSGHGAPRTKGDKFVDAYLIPNDVVITDPEALDETAIKVSYLQELVDTSSAKGVFIALDSCFSGGGKSIVPKGGKPLVGMIVSPELMKPKGAGKVIVTSSATNQQSWEDDSELKSGIFSHYLIEGLKGKGGKDAWVKVEELADYIKENVPKAAKKLKGADQIPQIAGRGDFAVTRNWERAKVMDVEIARGKLKDAFEKGIITAEQLSKAMDEMKSQRKSKTLEAFLEGKIDEKKFGELY